MTQSVENLFELDIIVLTQDQRQKHVIGHVISGELVRESLSQRD